MNSPPMEILLVEDDLNDIELALRAFRAHNIVNHVKVARDGEEALDYLQQESCVAPKLVLLDLKLPKVDGLEVLRTIRSDPRLCSLPVVILTSSREDRDIVESYDLGVNSYIVKPVEFEKLVEMTRTIGLYWLMLNHVPESAASNRAMVRPS
jgi:two-component system response regulator